MEDYDFCLAWNADEDRDFVRFLSDACVKSQLKLLQITSENFTSQQQLLIDNQIFFHSFFDRGSCDDERFKFLIQWVREHNTPCINRYEQTQRAEDKATMHQALISQGLQTPYSILLPSYRDQPELPPMDITLLGEKFIIKPAHGGGGEGVIKEAHSWDQVDAARKTIPEEMYLLQMFVVPRMLDGHQAWFRIINCTGKIFICWWDTNTHVYVPLSEEEKNKFNLQELQTIGERIAKICELELFSSEVALTAENLFIVVDYINEQIDLRLHSKTTDGIPDEIVREIADRLVQRISEWRTAAH